MPRPKVLVIMYCNFGFLHNPSIMHGGVLWAASLLENLAGLSQIEFTIVTSGPSAAQLDNQRFVEELGLDHIFVSFRRESIPRKFRRVVAAAARIWDSFAEKYYFMWERHLRRQGHVDAEVMEVVREEQPDLVLISEIYGVLLVPSVLSLSTPCCLITVNNEVAFHRTTKSLGGPVGEDWHHRLERWIYRRGNWISNSRFSGYMTRIYNRFAGIVALTPGDIPTDLPAHIVRAVIPPILRKNSLQWSYRGSRCVFFVGNIWTYSNRLAIEWICTRFAPELGRIDARVSINIVGASEEQVPKDWPRQNIKFMGYANRQEIVRQMITADLFIAPIANGHGAKLKLAECTSHGLPFLATHAAMSGLPFRAEMPQIDLEEPAIAAQLAMEYLNSPEALTKLSESIAQYAQHARAEQAAAWDTFLRRCIETGHDTEMMAGRANTLGAATYDGPASP